MNHRLVATVVVIAAALLVPAAPASATDQTLYQSWSTGYKAEGNKAVKRFNRAFKTWRRSDFRRWKGVYKASRGVQNVIKKLEGDIRGDSASSEGGARAREFALSSLSLSRRSYGEIAKAARLSGKKRYRAGAAALGRADKLNKRSTRATKQANEAFAALGFG